MISHKYKFIFVHPNKCGGNSIEFFFQGHLKVDHRPLTKYQSLYPERYEPYFKFGFARNPWDRLVSVYHGRVQGKFKPAARKPDRELAKYSFKDSVKLGKQGVMRYCIPLLDSHPAHWDCVPNQCAMAWYLDLEGRLGLDFIGKMENYDEDFATVLSSIDVPYRNLPHKNKSKHRHYSEYYDAESREIVSERYNKDIEHFGYKFGE